MAHKVEKRILAPGHLRRLRDGFSWIDRRFVNEGVIERLSQAEILLYFFLVAVADRHGLSYWSDMRVAALLGLAAGELAGARRGLIEHGLVAYERPLYQVLDLPAPKRTGEAASVGQILRQIGRDADAHHGR